MFWHSPGELWKTTESLLSQSVTGQKFETGNPSPSNPKQDWYPLVHDACRLSLLCKRNVNIVLPKTNTVSPPLDLKNAIRLLTFASLRLPSLLFCRLPQVPIFVLRILVIKMQNRCVCERQFLSSKTPLILIFFVGVG